MYVRGEMSALLYERKNLAIVKQQSGCKTEPAT